MKWGFVLAGVKETLVISLMRGMILIVQATEIVVGSVTERPSTRSEVTDKAVIAAHTPLI